jgi:hypothetical protein
MTFLIVPLGIYRLVLSYHPVTDFIGATPPQRGGEPSVVIETNSAKLRLVGGWFLDIFLIFEKRNEDAAQGNHHNLNNTL